VFKLKTNFQGTYMYYEFNVAKNGRHFFATAERSVTTETEAEVMHNVLTEKFPKSEGYSVSCTCWEKKGYSVEF
jgi:hypothetical protein